MIPFNKPSVTGKEKTYISTAIDSGKLCGDGGFGKRCQNWFEKKLKVPKTLLTPSCTHALELAAILLDIAPGDEIIMPSYTFVSTANAFVLRGAKIVFVDIRPDTMNIDEQIIESAINERTRAIVVVHYAGVACEMDTIMEIADRNSISVIEDAAQGMMSKYKGRYLGTIGHIGAYSFHETKNYTSGGEGGLLIINDENLVNRAEIVREKGTNRSQFFRGSVDKYTWMDIGSSLLPSEIQAAYLFAQLESVEKINEKRLEIWNRYYSAFEMFEREKILELPTIMNNVEHNAHMFYLKLKNIEHRSKFIESMKMKNVMCVFHYVPLHKSPAGVKYGTFFGTEEYTTRESERLVRLPLFYNMSTEEIEKVISCVLGTLNELKTDG